MILGQNPSTASTTAPTTSAATAGVGGSQANQLAYLLMGQGLPGVEQSMLQAVLGSQQLAMNPSTTNVSAAELGANSSYDLANQLLGYQGIGLQSQGLASQAQTAAQQQGVEQAQYGVQQGQYPEQMQEAALQNALTVAANQRQGAISGTTETTGFKQQQGAQAAEYGWQQADIFRQQQLAQLAQQSEQLGYGGQQEQYANQQQQLNLAAQQAGLGASQSYAQLGFGLNQLGISQAPEQFLQSIANAQGGASTGLAGILSQASLTGGLGPNFISGVG